MRAYDHSAELARLQAESSGRSLALPGPADGQPAHLRLPLLSERLGGHRWLSVAGQSMKHSLINEPTLATPLAGSLARRLALCSPFASTLERYRFAHRLNAHSRASTLLVLMITWMINWDRADQSYFELSSLSLMENQRTKQRTVAVVVAVAPSPILLLLLLLLLLLVQLMLIPYAAQHNALDQVAQPPPPPLAPLARPEVAG